MKIEKPRQSTMPWKAKHYKQLRELNDMGLTYIQIAQIMGRTSAAVQFQMTQKDIPYKHKENREAYKFGRLRDDSVKYNKRKWTHSDGSAPSYTMLALPKQPEILKQFRSIYD